MSEKHLPPEALNDWIDELAAVLGLPPEAIDVQQVLEMASVVAHQVARPAAPVSAFAAGLAAGLAVGAQGSNPASSGETLAKVITAAQTWQR